MRASAPSCFAPHTRVVRAGHGARGAVRLARKRLRRWRTAIRTSLRCMARTMLLCAAFTTTAASAGQLGSGSHPPAAAPAPSATFVLIDGQTRTGAWHGTRDGDRVGVAASGRTDEIPLASLRSIEFAAADLPGSISGRTSRDGGAALPGLPASDDRPWLMLHDGSRFPVRILESLDAGVRVATPFGTDTAVTFEALAALQWGDPVAFPAAETAFQSTRRVRRLGEDQLITRSTADVRVVPGRIESLGNEGGTFVFQDRSRPFAVEKMYAIVMALPAAEPTPATIRVVFENGAVLAGELASADATNLRLVSATLGDVSVPLAGVSRVLVRSERLVQITDLSPTSQQVEGRLHESPTVGFDTSPTGGPLRTGGQGFERGLGLRSFTRLDYDLGRRFETLVLTAGIDDAVRPRGAVDLRVIGDGRTLVDSFSLTGIDPPREIRADVRGVRQLSLIVDYGDGVDLADHVVLGDARLLRPAPATETGRAAP